MLAADGDVDALRTALGARGSVLGIGPTRDRRAALTALLEHSPVGPFLLLDAERALTPAATIRAVLEAATQDPDAEAIVPGIEMTDSVKAADENGLRNVDRSQLATLQSPRLLTRSALECAVAHWRHDEVSSLLAQGHRVRLVHGSHAGFAIVDRLTLWQAQIALGLSRDTSGRQGLGRRS